MRAVTYIFGLALLSMSVLMTGCSEARLMMPAPNVHLDTEPDYFADLTPVLKNTEVPLFYITDRAPEQDEQGSLRYGYERSPSLGFGTAVVDLGVDITWEELLDASRAQRRPKPMKLGLGELKEIVRGPQTPLPYSEVDGRIIES